MRRLRSLAMDELMHASIYKCNHLEKYYCAIYHNHLYMDIDHISICKLLYTK